MIEKHLDAVWEIQGVFFDRFEKVADFSPEIYVPPEIQDFIHNYQPDPRFCCVHVIAATDGRRYGSNLNGDILDGEEMLGMQPESEAMQNPGEMSGISMPRYKTFEQARFYRHHANSPIDPPYGDIPVSAWNEPMRRVELIIRIYKQDMPELGGYGAPDIVAKLDRRGFITVSMGMKIHHEQCEYCGKCNELVKDRCPCLRDNMNQIMPNGQRVQANNLGMRFFDCSDVTIPADPACFSIAKVATFGNRPNQAFDVETYIMGAWTSKYAEMTKEFSMGSIAAVSVDLIPALGMSDEIPGDLSDEFLKAAFVTGGNLDTLVSTAALMGIVLSPRELVFATTLQEPGKTAELKEYAGIRNLCLDNFSVSLYHSLFEKAAQRSGYCVPCHRTGWQPAKIAQAGYKDVADYYSFYRGLLGALPRDSFVKAAHRNPYVRELLGSTCDGQIDRVQNALYHLAHAGMVVL